MAVNALYDGEQKAGSRTSTRSSVLPTRYANEGRQKHNKTEWGRSSSCLGLVFSLRVGNLTMLDTAFLPGPFLFLSLEETTAILPFCWTKLFFLSHQL